MDMLNRTMLYNVLYALAARSGRDKALFGSCHSLSQEAFERSLACDAFPEIWFELPLAGEPWFDLHALTARADLKPGMTFMPQATGGNPEVFSWFAAQEQNVRQLALSWDVSSGDISQPAVQLLLSRDNPDTTCGFLKAAGRPDAVNAYRAFWRRQPDGWFACYAGVFPRRPNHNLRVECIPDSALQSAYAVDAGLLEAHLQQMGLDETEGIVSACQTLAKTPFHLEFQFDVEPDGKAGLTFGASVRFSDPPGTEEWQPYSSDGATERLMTQLEAWGLADDRWRRLSECAFANSVALGDERVTLCCYPAFVKLRWRAGVPLDAKTYLIAGVR
jgi:hypothetical protein